MEAAFVTWRAWRAPNARVVFLISLSALNAACGDTPPAFSTLSFGTHDLTTGQQDQAVVRVAVADVVGESADGANNLSDTFRVEGSDGSVSGASVVPRAGEHLPGLSEFDVSWPNQVEGVWYFVSVSPEVAFATAGIDEISTVYARQTDSGRVGVRVALGERPVLARIEYFLQDGQPYRMLLAFSEPVRIREGLNLNDVLAVHDVGTGDPIPVADYGERLIAERPDIRLLRGGHALRDWSIECSRYPEVMRIDLSGDAIAVGGTPLSSLDGTVGRSLELEITALPLLHAEARVWQEPL